MPVLRTEYRNLATQTVRGLATGHGESLTDMESYLMPLEVSRNRGLFTAGVVEGLELSVDASAALHITPGTAIDGTGRLILLPGTGYAVTDPSVPPDAVENVPTVTVGPSGLVLGAPPGGGSFVLVISWREVAGTPAAFVRLHAPWVRLIPTASYDPSSSLVVLGQVTWDGSGLNPVLIPLDRAPARQQTILSTTATTAVVRQQVAGAWTGQPAGGVTLKIANTAGMVTALEAAPDGSVGIGTLAVDAVLTTSYLTVTADAEFRGPTVLRDGLTLNADLAVHGKLAVSGTDSWLRLNQDNAFSSGTHTPGHLTSGSLNVGGLGGWETAGPGNALVIGKVTAAGGAALSGIAVGVSSGVAYPFDYETVGVTDPGMNLRLQSPGSVVVHAGGDVRLDVSSGAVDINSDASVHGKHAIRGTDTWLRLNQDNAFTSGTHTPGHLSSGSLNVGGFGGWESGGFGNVRALGQVTAAGGAALSGIVAGLSAGVAYPFDYETVGVTEPWMNLRLQSPGWVIVHAGGDVRLQISSGAVDINSDVSVRGKHAIRGTDTWLRLNQDNAFPSGTHTPGMFFPNSLNVGGYANAGNPGGGNAWIAGSLYVHGRVQLGGGDEQVIIGGNQTGPFMQLHDDMWLSDPQDGTIELKNADFGWGSLKGIFLSASSETYKKDVVPLALDELGRLLTDALATEVVHFRYHEDGDDVPTRLGVIAERAPDYIVDAPARGVLLPEYSAMLLGALQALAARFGALEARISELG